jgi:hypothetical protein
MVCNKKTHALSLHHESVITGERSLKNGGHGMGFFMHHNWCCRAARFEVSEKIFIRSLVINEQILCDFY